MTAIPLERTIDYPESDGRPMAETEVHGQVLFDLIHGLRRRYVDVPDVYAWGNMILYYEEGNSQAFVAPDVFLARGVDKRVRRTYKVWEEGQVPFLIIEVTSKSTRGEDLNTKKRLYESLGVEEYFLFDPLAEYLKPRLQGFRLGSGNARNARRYEALLPQAAGALLSTTTDLVLQPEGDRLRLRDAITGEPLAWPDEDAVGRQAAEEKVRALEEELARLRADRRKP
jgi:Uma2 family endonuclease